MIVNRTRDQFLTSSGLAQQQHRGITWRDCLDQLQHLPECRAVADNLIEVHLAANLFFEIELLLREPIFESRYLAVGEGVLDGDRYLPGDVRQQLHVFFRESTFTAAGYVECSQGAVMCDEGNDASRPEPIIVCVPDLRGREFAEIQMGYKNRLAGSEGEALGTACQRKQCTFFKIARILEIEAVQSQLFAFCVVKGNRSCVVRNNPAQGIAGTAQHTVQA